MPSQRFFPHHTTFHRGAWSLLLLGAVSVALAPCLALAVDPPVKVNGTVVSGGNIQFGSISPDGNWVVYVGDQDQDGIAELFSVPLHGGAPVTLNPPLPSGRRVSTDFAITADSRRVVFRSNPGGADEVFSVPIEGGTVTRLSRTLPAGGAIFSILLSPDGERVIYAGEQDRDGVGELYSVPVGGGTVTKISGPMTTNGNTLNTRAISPDSRRVVYLADQERDGVNELYSVAIDGGTVTKLNAPLPTGGDVAVSGIRISSDSRTVVYMADQLVDNMTELFSVPIAGGTPVRISGPMLNGSGDVFEFLVNADNQRVVFRGDLEVDGLNELYRAPIEGGAVSKLSDPALGDMFFFDLSADGSTVVYQTSVDIDELYSVPIEGGVITRLNAPLPSGSAVGFFDLSADGQSVIYTLESTESDDPATALFSVPTQGGVATPLVTGFAEGRGINNFTISPLGDRVVYSADQDTAGFREIYLVPVGGGGNRKVNGTLVAGGRVSSFRYSPDGDTMLYIAEQDAVDVRELFSVSGMANDPPVITALGDQQVLEDAAITTLTVQVADSDSAPVDLLVSAASSQPTLIADPGVQAGATADTRRLRFAPAANTSGSATITVTVIDTEGAGAQRTFAIQVLAVNDAPLLSLGTVETHGVGSSGARSVPGFASVVLGPADEAATQNISDFLLQVSDENGVLSAIDISNDGTLSYRLTGAAGTTSIAVRVRDDGGTGNGGVDTSSVQNFTITVAQAPSGALLTDGFE